MPVRLHSRRRRQYYAVQNARGVKAANSASGWKAQSSRVDILHGQWCRAPRKQRFVSRLLTHLRDALAFAAGLKKVSPAADDMEDDDPWEEPAVPDIEPSNTGCDGKVRGCSVCGHWRKVAQYGGVRAPWLCAACWLEGDQAAAVGMTTLTSSNPYTKVPEGAAADIDRGCRRWRRLPAACTLLRELRRFQSAAAAATSALWSR
eukprot:TRINITY_DN61866_c0_g1_i1.p1 TRINITY_DN61866_c0_g1~~TRINITY_DN61866_c0_g1_i1.p1  ORF type:complete len:236 (-),score=39.36 TRINITY_DN61866_c0_g1_i1:690-1301(-)